MELGHTQIAIPDLDDDDEIISGLPQPAFASAGASGRGSGGPGSGSESVPTGSLEDLRGPSRPWLTHGRSGSGTSGESSLGDGSSIANSKAHGAGGWSFPRKGSFANLKAAIKGGGSSNNVSSAAPSSFASTSHHDHNASTASSHANFSSAPRSFHRTISAGNAREAGAASTPYRRADPYVSSHQRNDSQLSGQSRATSQLPSTSMHSKGHHAQQASYFSELSAGHASSTGSQAHGMPPIPPFPEQFSQSRGPGSNYAAMYGSNELPGDGGSGQPEEPQDVHGTLHSYPALQEPWPVELPAEHINGVRPRLAYDPLSGAAFGGRSTQQSVLPAGIGSPDPHTPSDFALNVLMSRFLTRTQIKVQAVLDHGLEVEPDLDTSFGNGVDEDFDSLLRSLAHVGRSSPKLVLESLANWHALHVDTAIDADTVRRAMAEATQASGPPHNGNTGPGAASVTGSGGVRDTAFILGRRKMLVCTFLLARTLIEIAKQLQPGAVAEADVDSLLSQLFDLLQSCSQNQIPRSGMQIKAFTTVSLLLGELSRKYFLPIGDRFISMLEHCARVPLSKSVELAQEIAVEGMRNLIITVFPMEQFEEGAEILGTVGKFFAGAHGQRVKSAYAETLTQLILPVARSASAEINHPTWTKAIDMIAPRAAAMASKPRYWPVAYPLYVATLCAAPEEQFLQGIGGHSGWFPCLEAALPRIKDRVLRPLVMGSAIRLIWVYMYRCRESSSTTAKRLDTFYKLWFPALRPAVVLPSESSLLPHIEMVHLALYRHFEFGRDLILDFMRHSVLGGSTLSLQPDIIMPQRMIIAIRAVALTLAAYVKGESPAFPDSSGHTGSSLSDDAFTDLGDELPEAFTHAKAEIADAQVKFNDLIGKIALICDHQVGSTTVFDETVLILKANGVSQGVTALDYERYTTRAHNKSRLSVGYARDQQPYMDLHRVCIDTWPRCLSASIPFASVLSCLFRAHWSADPILSEAASQGLRRIAKQRKGGAAAVVSGFGREIFRADAIFWEIHPHQVALLPKVEAAVKVWMEFLNIWLLQLRASQTDQPGDNSMERTSAWAINDEVEAYGLLLLCSGYRHLRRQGTSILRVVAVLDDAFSTSQRRPTSGHRESVFEPTRIIHLLDLPCRDFCNAEDSQLSVEQRSRVRDWRRTNSSQPLSDLAESDVAIEHSLWQHVLPRFLRMCLEHFPTTVAVFRSHVTSRVLCMDAAVAIAAGLVPRSAATLNGSGTTKSLPATSSGSMSGSASISSGTGSAADRALMAEHWKFYILALCTTTTSTEGSRGALHAGGHRRKSSDGSSSERVIAARDLFQKLVPFLASDQTKFRDAVVTALGNINVNLYRTLLETLQAVSSQLQDTSKGKSLGRGAPSTLRHVRLRTAIGHVVQLTSSHMAVEETLSDGPIMALILNWVTNTFNFLTQKIVRSDWDFQQLRRFFCGVVEDLYQGLKPRGESERYFPFETRFRMFKLFSEWYSFSQSAKDGPIRLAGLLADVAEHLRDDRQRELVITSLRGETQALSFHASDAMATLCQGSITPPPGTTDSHYKTAGSPFEASWLTQWLQGLFKSSSPTDHVVARRALRSLIWENAADGALIGAIIEGAFGEADSIPSERSLFSGLSEAITAPGVLSEKTSAPLHHILVLGLTKLGHRDSEIRRKAFALIDAAARKETPTLSLHAVEAGISSPLPATYLRAQRDASTFLAHHFGSHKVAFVCEASARIALIDPSRRSTTLGLLPDWLRDIDLLQGADSAGGGNELTHCSLLVLSNLLYLTIRYGDEHNFEIQDAWASLAEGTQVLFNANAIVKFLVEQSLCYRSPIFIVHAKRVVSCLSHTIIAPHMFDELCAFIEPASMIAVPREQIAVQSGDAAHNTLFQADLDILLPTASKQQTFSPGQLALLFVCELTYERSERLSSQVHLLLHALVMQVDSFIPFVQEQATAAFEQLMRSLVSMSAPTVGAENAARARGQVEELFSRGSTIFWSHSELQASMCEARAPPGMLVLLREVLKTLNPLLPGLEQRWADLALHWATSGPVRHLACRSFQSFRIMLPSATPKMLADMLGRLSNTISDPNIDIQSFSLEILYTLTALIRATDQQRQDIFTQIFWAAVACLNTANEIEFAVAIEMVDGLLDKLDIDDVQTIQTLTDSCPEGWEGELGGIQPLVLRGLRSSLTSAASFKTLMRISKIRNSALIDASGDRIAFLFVTSLPWFLQASDVTQAKDPLILDHAQNVADLCEHEGRADLSRVAASIAKTRFRTRDDLIRQAVNSLRANFLSRLGPSLAVALLGLTLNQHEWLRTNTLQVLKIFFQAVDTRSREFASLGSELLMPLLRLLSTSLASQALDVLDEPIAISGGPGANQVLRMSLQWGKPNRRREHANDASIFGAPDDSGWAVANPQELTTKTRINVQAVFKTCELTLDVAPVSMVDFVNEEYYYASPPTGLQGQGYHSESLGDIVDQLRELTSFFADGETTLVPAPEETPLAIETDTVPFPAGYFPMQSAGGQDVFLPQTSKILTRSNGAKLWKSPAPGSAGATMAMAMTMAPEQNRSDVQAQVDDLAAPTSGQSPSQRRSADLDDSDEFDEEDAEESSLNHGHSASLMSTQHSLNGSVSTPAESFSSSGQGPTDELLRPAASQASALSSSSRSPLDWQGWRSRGTGTIASQLRAMREQSASPVGSTTPRGSAAPSATSSGSNRRSFFYRKSSANSSFSSSKGSVVTPTQPQQPIESPRHARTKTTSSASSG